MRNQIYQSMVTKAREHGMQSDPEHEVGDLQEFLWDAIQMVPVEQLATLMHRAQVD
jgi:hypothetical protein